ncbi:MAG: histidine kinase [Bacteroidetes bacterium]|nr:histidine kinase [Bacteroidota bacterium]MBU1720082.1 histidine kinase [Bacteroidota bacterium]
MIHPILNNKTALPLFVVIWALLAGAHIAVYTLYYNAQVADVVPEALVSWLLFGLFSFSLWYPIRFSQRENADIQWQVAGMIIMHALILLVWIAMAYLVVQVPFSGESGYNEIFIQTIAWRCLVGELFLTITTLAYIPMVNHEKLMRKEEEKVRLKSLVRETELNALKSQVNPHFLFNSLNSISSLTISEPEKARKMINMLSEFLRYSLKDGKHKLVALKEELYHIDLFLDIEKVRFGKRLAFEINMPTNCGSATIPAMLLLPLAENAIKHGVYHSSGEVVVTMDFALSENILNVEIRNNFDSDSPRPKGTGTGIRNVRERLRLVYNDDNLLEVHDTGSSFIVTLDIPQNFF